MSICGKRPDGGIGSFKKILTTCTADTFLIPLPALFVLLMFCVCFAMRARSPGERDDRPMPLSTYPDLPTPPTQSKLKFFSRSPQPDVSAGVLNRAALESYRDERERREKKSGLRFLLAVLGGGVLLGAGGLEVFEMAKMSTSGLGIGLLPLPLISSLLIVLSLFIPLHATNKRPSLARPHFLPWTFTCFTYGILLCVMFGVRLNSLIAVEGVLGEAKVDEYGKGKVGYYTYGMRKMHTVIICILYGTYSLLYGTMWYFDVKAT